jgi:uncharacterized membrane-anchored protein
MTTHRATPSGTRLLLSKVPEVTAYFWIIKVLCTTVGEAAADFLNVSVNLGLTGTSIATGLLLVIVLAAQFAANRYTPVRYWSAVTLVSVFGTLVTDNLTDSLGVPLEVSTIVFGVLLAGTFTAWYRIEGTLSIHSILTRRREAFYWLAILVTFALGTAARRPHGRGARPRLPRVRSDRRRGDRFRSRGVAARPAPVLAFWIIYVLTRPLGASIGDYLSQPASSGGLGLGATTTSLIFVAAIIGIVVYLSVTKADVIRGAVVEVEDRGPRPVDHHRRGQEDRQLAEQEHGQDDDRPPAAQHGDREDRGDHAHDDHDLGVTQLGGDSGHGVERGRAVPGEPTVGGGVGGLDTGTGKDLGDHEPGADDDAEQQHGGDHQTGRDVAPAQRGGFPVGHRYERRGRLGLEPVVGRHRSTPLVTSPHPERGSRHPDPGDPEHEAADDIGQEMHTS